MQRAKFIQHISQFILSLLLCGFMGGAVAHHDHEADAQAGVNKAKSVQLLLVEADTSRLDDERPRSGSLVLPAAAGEEKVEKKCMTVCERWGEDCMIDSRRGVRKCRRTCKEFGQECF